MGLQGVDLAVRRRIVQLLQRINVLHELGAVLRRQLIPCRADVRILEALGQVGGEGDVIELLSRQHNAQLVQVRALDDIQGYARQAGDLLRYLILAPGIHCIPIKIDIQRQGNGGGVLLPGEVLPGGRGAVSGSGSSRFAFGSRGGVIAGSSRGRGVCGSRGGRGGIVRAASSQADSQHHAQRQQRSKKLLVHLRFPPLFFTFQRVRETRDYYIFYTKKVNYSKYSLSFYVVFNCSLYVIDVNSYFCLVFFCFW